MADVTGIAWAGLPDEFGDLMAGATLNVAAGCTKRNDACKFCYAMPATARLAVQLVTTNPDLSNLYASTVKETSQGWQWSNTVVPLPHRLDDWIRKVRMRGVFVSSMTDIFHEALTDEYIDLCFGMMAVKQDRFYVLTKRPERMAEYLLSREKQIRVAATEWLKMYPKAKHLALPEQWPLPNIWCGTSPGAVDTRQEYLEHLARVPAVVRWISEEPLIDDPNLYEIMVAMKLPAELRDRFNRHMDNPEGINPVFQWSVYGGESDSGFSNLEIRPMEIAWVEHGIRDCRTLKISAFVKQKGTLLAHEMGCKSKKGDDPAEWPTNVQIREFPDPSKLLV